MGLFAKTNTALITLLAAGQVQAQAAGDGLSGIQEATDSFLDFISSGWGLSLLTLVIMGVGLALWFRMLSGVWALRILGGSFLIFGAPRIGTWLQGIFV